MNDEDNELKKLWRMMNSPGWDNQQLAKLMFINCSWDTKEYDLVYFVLLYTNVTRLEALEFSKNVTRINPEFFESTEKFKDTLLCSIGERWAHGDLNGLQLKTVKEIKAVTGWGLKVSKDYFDENFQIEFKPKQRR